MSKIKSAFFCQHCGYESVKWVGQCPSCGQWNTFVEELIQKETIKNGNGWKEYNNDTRINKTISLIEITSSEDERLSTADAELIVIGWWYSSRKYYFSCRRTWYRKNQLCFYKMDYY